MRGRIPTLLVQRTIFLSVLASLALAPAVARADPFVVHDVRTGTDPLGGNVLTPGQDAIQDYVQPDTQIEPSIAINPKNPLNVIAVYQEGRIANGGDATNGFTTSFDGGKTWTSGELPGLTDYPSQNGPFERASDAVVAFGPDGTAYANSLVFTQDTDNGLRSGMAINVSKDGGRTWGKPVFFQDDQLGGLNDKNWIAVDQSDAPGHHKGRVYAVWDRVAPVVYDYCDANCDDVNNWLPDLQTVDPIAFPGQGIGAYPFVMKSGSLGMVIETTTPGAPTGADEPEPGSSDDHVFMEVPNAGSIPYPSPLPWSPPIHVGANKSNGVPAQRGSDGLPAAAADPKSGALYAVWDDGRFRKDGTNDIVFAKSTDEGQTWSAPKPVNPPPRDDHMDHNGASVAVSEDGVVHVAYRVRDESGAPPLYSPYIDTYYQESRDGGKTWSDPLKVDAQPSNAYYDAFSRDGSFEGDYDQLASSGGYTYIVREQGQPNYPGERPALTAASTSPPQVALTEAGKGHQHQMTWVALVRDGTPGTAAGGGGSSAGGGGSSSGGGGSVSAPTSGAAESSTSGTSPLPASLPGRRSCLSRRSFSIHVRQRKGSRRIVSVSVTVNGKRVAVRRGKKLRSHIDLRGLPRERVTVRVVARTKGGRRLVAKRTYHTCVPKKKRP